MRLESAPCLDPARNDRSLDVTVIAEKSFRALDRAVDYDVVLRRQNAVDVDRCILVCGYSWVFASKYRSSLSSFRFACLPRSMRIFSPLT